MTWPRVESVAGCLWMVKVQCPWVLRVSLGSSAGPEPAHGPGRRRDTGKVRPARPGRQLHRHIRPRCSRLRASGLSALRSRRRGLIPVMERWIGSCRRELPDRTLVWNQRHLMIMLREYEDFCSRHRPHRALNQAAPLRPLPDGVTDLDQLRVQRRDRAGGVIHEYRLVA